MLSSGVPLQLDFPMPSDETDLLLAAEVLVSEVSHSLVPTVATEPLPVADVADFPMPIDETG